MKKQIFSLLSIWAMSALSSPIIAEENQTLNHSQSLQLISTPDPNRVPVDELRLFTEIFEQLKNNYVDPISDQTLIHNAIKGMLALDPHSKYYSKEEYQKIKNQTSGSFAGIGIETQYNTDKSMLLIQKVFENSPASKAQLQVNDQIQKIDGKSITEMTPDQLPAILQGELNSSITLTILRDNDTFELTLKRDNIPTPSLSIATLYNQEFAYLKIDRFQQRTDEEIIQALTKLKAEAQTQHSELRGVILDLRDNLGGLLTASVEVADLFLDKGLITYTVGQTEQSKERYEAQKGDIIDNIPLIVLINAQSASSSEIVAGALQDHQRALIVGENSYGKGSIQMIQPLKNGDAIRYTSARYYTPNGNSIQNDGITPDIILPTIKAQIIQHDTTREIDNTGHLENTKRQNRNQRMPASFADLLENGDFPLYEALNILRAVSHQALE